MKKLFFSLIIFLTISFELSAQYCFENRDVKLLLDIDYINDTTLHVTGSVINKLDNAIYYSGFASEFKHEELYFYGYAENELVIQLGNTSKMIPGDYLISVTPIKSRDTAFLNQTIISQFFSAKNRLYLSFDYLNINKFDGDVKNKIEIIQYPDSHGVLGCPCYRKYCEWFELEIPYVK